MTDIMTQMQIESLEAQFDEMVKKEVDSRIKGFFEKLNIKHF